MVDMLLPRTCIVCGRKLNVSEKYLCLHCASDIPLTRFGLMSHNPMADKFNEAIQKELNNSWRQEAYAFASALFFYKDESGYKHIPHQIKYQGNISAGRYFGRMLGRELRSADWASDVDMVIPVPLHWKRRWSRGYNQAEIIAEGVAAELAVPMRTDILKRGRKTQTQTKLDVSEKMVNVAGAFLVSQSAVCSGGVSDSARHNGSDNCDRPTATMVHAKHTRHILLVDDVFTTGSTLYACFLALRTVFPPSVRISVATLAFVGEA
jgi:predicted amidophosphoribosyltransferase